ncbi:hypothetical protein KVR01_009521 [Diaporthe batatas]|uniref:uncharacterized protein n=1 Tax=Diaporthe batatas TaxID=748121 RepID=UPI001D048842|nr:uncharacterized protein KVR01_009521 [Diaporthe batatas]KAG8161257.1 hypothetical protein KVR01_009521 [Diaporthe batatas]
MPSYNGLVLLSTLPLAYIISTVVYRLYFHPLAKYPGPFWGKISEIPSYWHAVKQDRHLWLYQLQEQYGTLLVNNPDGFRSVYGPKGNVKKGLYYLIWPRNVDTLTTLNVIDHEVHARKRRVLNSSFSDKALRSAEKFVLSNTNRWCDLIDGNAEQGGGGDGWSASLNMTDWVNHLVFDILGDLCFGKQFNMKEPDSELRYVPELIAGFMQFMHPIAWSPIAGFWAWLKPRGLDKLLELATPPALKRWESFVEKCLAERTREEQAREEQLQAGLVAEGETRKDFFHYIYHAEDPETGTRGFPKHEMYGETELLIIAGSDTTAIVMAGLLFYLVRNPAAYARLVDEVRSAFSSSSEIQSGPRLQSCRYLRACINEGLRMTPPVACEPLREVMAGGTDVDGESFPPGVNVSVAFYCLSHNKDVYPEPHKFRPERWLVDEKAGITEEDVARAESGACSFSMGSRGCPGKYLALIEMTIVMAKLVYLFDMREDPDKKVGGGGPGKGPGRENPDLYQTYDIFVSLHDGPMIQFKRRG